MEHIDLLVVGGGINGIGIARDAAGRGLSVLVAEKDDLASHTSSWSSKLIHGGLRYLEQYEFRLVAESLAEREVLLGIAWHLVSPMRFVMPHVPELRPRWMIRIGLFLYDHLGRRTKLPGSHGVSLAAAPYNSGLKATLRNGFIYSDCRVDDARLVVANALDARRLGATILTRTACVSAHRKDGLWVAQLSGPGGVREVSARAIVNAAGPWVKEVLNGHLHQPSRDGVRLVKGSHIVVPKLYEGGHAFILQNDDKRVVFMIPYEGRYTLVGTTDVTVEGDPGNPQASDEEVAYLCRAVNRYLDKPVAPGDVVWRYSGIRPLYDDGTSDPSAVTRDYTLRVDDDQGAAAVLSVFGGKITTYRRLAEHALEKLAPYFPGMKPAWTQGRALPGSELGTAPEAAFERLRADYPQISVDVLRGIFRRHGLLARQVLGDARSEADLDEHFGAGLHAREVSYLVEHEWATSAEDVLWRRTKAGLHLSPAQRDRVAAWLASR
ncbi:MAG: glycerol-3-phosphate dehydrogenase [Proteobacteria bacterium]|nr:glycerol-3-phosphate dehydrogenase [Pseudomonadota bacterium]